MSLSVNAPRPVFMAHLHREQFTAEFLLYLNDNLHVFEAFEVEALKVIERGMKHYSARTIIEVLRHHSSLREADGQWKLNDRHTPYLSRLFALCNPNHATLFEFRTAKSAQKERASA